MECDSCEIVAGQAIVAGRNASPVLEAANQPLDPIAPLVGDLAVLVGHHPGGRGYGLTDAQWEQIAPLLPPQKPRTGRPAEDHRQVLNSMLWILRTGAPWEDLPARYGAVGTVSSRFYRWRQGRRV